jgi:gamma-glutamylcyclotransferase (GGCT)/AIG2-like uncharacterized protein YtfP
MDWQQMQRRCPSAKFICVARLADYRFAIARHSRLRNCGTANIFAERGSEVWGVVYEVSAEDLLELDAFEDGYCREKVSVTAAANGGAAYEVLVYIAQKEEKVPLPNAAYKRHLIDGARHWRLPGRYCEMLETIDAGDL